MIEAGSRVNLELPLRVGDPLEGHLVQGHIDAIGKVNLESDLFVKSARDLWRSAQVTASRTLSSLPWAGTLTGPAGIEKCAAHLAARGGVVIHDERREAEADVVFAGATMRPEAMVFLLTQVCGHTTVPCDIKRLERLEIPPMPGAGDRHATAYHVSVDLAVATSTDVSAHDRAATIRRLAHPEATPSDFLRPGHVFPLAGRPGGLGVRRGHTEASLALCEPAGLPTVARRNLALKRTFGSYRPFVWVRCLIFPPGSDVTRVSDAATVIRPENSRAHTFLRRREKI